MIFLRRFNAVIIERIIFQQFISSPAQAGASEEFIELTAQFPEPVCKQPAFSPAELAEDLINSARRGRNKHAAMEADPDAFYIRSRIMKFAERFSYSSGKRKPKNASMTIETIDEKFLSRNSDILISAFLTVFTCFRIHQWWDASTLAQIAADDTFYSRPFLANSQLKDARR